MPKKLMPPFKKHDHTSPFKDRLFVNSQYYCINGSNTLKFSYDSADIKQKHRT